MHATRAEGLPGIPSRAAGAVKSASEYKHFCDAGVPQAQCFARTQAPLHYLVHLHAVIEPGVNKNDLLRKQTLEVQDWPERSAPDYTMCDCVDRRTIGEIFGTLLFGYRDHVACEYTNLLSVRLRVVQRDSEETFDDLDSIYACFSPSMYTSLNHEPFTVYVSRSTMAEDRKRKG